MEEQRRRSYSSYTTARRSHGRSRYKAGITQPQVDYKEVVLSQCIVCGVILIIALSVNLIDSGITNGIRRGMKTALSSETTIGSITDGIAGLTQSYTGIKNSINTIFGRIPDDEDLWNAEEYAAIETDQPVTNEVPAADDSSNSAYSEQSVQNQAAVVSEETEQETFNQTSKAITQEAVIINDENFRIDEDILAQIDSMVDFYVLREVSGR